MILALGTNVKHYALSKTKDIYIKYNIELVTFETLFCFLLLDLHFLIINILNLLV